jgi:hypothetical protein
MTKPKPIDWQWLLGVFSLLIAVAVVFFAPALPYKLNNAVSAVLLLAFVAAGTWLAYRVRSWRREAKNPGRRAPWAAAVTTLVLLAGLLLTVVPQEETGYVSANCTFGSWGYGYGIVWAKIEPDDKDAVTTVTVKWGRWYGRPEPRRLTETTYFTFQKRDFTSGPADVMVDPAAKITCGDGRPADDHPSIHINGHQWSRTPPPTPANPPPTSPPPTSPPRSVEMVSDGDDPTGCTADVRRVHQQPVYTPEGRQLGTLELLQSVECNAMWGRLAVDQPAQPPKGWAVTLTVVRSGDSRSEPTHAAIRTTAVFTGVLRDDGSCFRVTATIQPGDVRPKTPCKR